MGCLLWLFYCDCIWVRSRNWGCLVTWFCNQLIAKPVPKQAQFRDLTHTNFNDYINRYYPICTSFSLYQVIETALGFLVADGSLMFNIEEAKAISPTTGHWTLPFTKWLWDIRLLLQIIWGWIAVNGRHFKVDKLHALRPEQNGLHLHQTFWNAIFWIKRFVFCFKFHWSLFLMTLLTKHWFR